MANVFLDKPAVQCAEALTELIWNAQSATELLALNELWRVASLSGLVERDSQPPLSQVHYDYICKLLKLDTHRDTCLTVLQDAAEVEPDPMWLEMYKRKLVEGSLWLLNCGSPAVLKLTDDAYKFICEFHKKALNEYISPEVFIRE